MTSPVLLPPSPLSAKNVKAAVWLLDWLYSEEGQICYNFGIEGESYEMKDGKPVYTDLIMNNPDGMSVAQALAAYTRASTSAPYPERGLH